MKILEKRYPLGSLPGQKTPGRYIDGTLWENIKLLAKSITKDMTYLLVISSSTLEVGTGKSVFSQQFAEAYLEAVRQIHGINNRLSMNNIVFRPTEIIKRSFEVPQYSSVICDEWEDLHYWSELGISLRQYFRKCRQLNQLVIVIIPNFFQLPMSYAISRSVAFIDIKFGGEFDRGFFSFYNFQTKKKLYLLGKKTQNYNVVRPNFMGRFVDGYTVDEGEYKKEKLMDLLQQEKLEKKPFTEKQIKVILFKQLYERLEDMSIKRLAKGFGISERTGNRWLAEDVPEDNDDKTSNINYLMNRDDDNQRKKQ